MKLTSFLEKYHALIHIGGVFGRKRKCSDWATTMYMTNIVYVEQIFAQKGQWEIVHLTILLHLLEIPMLLFGPFCEA